MLAVIVVWVIVDCASSSRSPAGGAADAVTAAATESRAVAESATTEPVAILVSFAANVSFLSLGNIAVPERRHLMIIGKIDRQTGRNWLRTVILEPQRKSECDRWPAGRL